MIQDSRTKIRHLGRDAAIAMRCLVAPLRANRTKVFAVGFNKCGTTSLDDLFRSLGLLSFHGERWRECEDLRLLRAYDCFGDGIPRDLPKLDRAFPGSRFILQVRDLEGWVCSRLAHIERRKTEPGYRLSPGWDDTDDAVKSWITQRNDYHRFVLSYFADRPSDLLVVNFIRDPSAATRVSAFLGYEGRFERPRKNVNPSRKRPPRHTDMLSRCRVELGIAEAELSYDILCPSLLEPAARAAFPADSATLRGA